MKALKPMERHKFTTNARKLKTVIAVAQFPENRAA
jgi:hypothetical protein